MGRGHLCRQAPGGILHTPALSWTCPLACVQGVLVPKLAPVFTRVVKILRSMVLCYVTNDAYAITTVTNRDRDHARAGTRAKRPKSPGTLGPQKDLLSAVHLHSHRRGQTRERRARPGPTPGPQLQGCVHLSQTFSRGLNKGEVGSWPQRDVQLLFALFSNY